MMAAAQQRNLLLRPASAQDELAGVLRGLRQAAGLSPVEFARRAAIPELQIKLIEAEHALPSRDALHAYLEIAAATPQSRANAMKLWSLARKGHEERRKARHAVRTDDDGPATMLLPPVDEVDDEDARVWMDNVSNYRGRSGGGREIADTRLSLSKPSWRRTAQTSQADPTLWPAPEQIGSTKVFVESLEGIKRSTGMSYKALAEASARTSYPLAISTVHAMCTKERLPSSVESLRCFIRICGADVRLANRWTGAWQRLRQVTEKPQTEHAADAEAARHMLIAANIESTVINGNLKTAPVTEDDAKSAAGAEVVVESMATSTAASEDVGHLESARVWTLPDDMIMNASESSPPTAALSSRLRRTVLLVSVFLLGTGTGALMLHLLG